MGIRTREQQIMVHRAAKQAESDAQGAAKEAAKLAALADARSITVADVLQRAGFLGKRDGSRIEYRQAGRDSNIKTLGEAWSDNLTGQSGYGGFYLAQHLQIDSGTLPRRTYMPPAPMKPEAKPPAEVLANWQHVRQWLTSPLPGRGICPDVVDAARENGLIYADYKKRAVFVRQGSGVFVRSTNPDGEQEKKTFGKGGNLFIVPGDGRLFVAESAINALSLLQLHSGATVIATGGDFNPDKLKALIEQAAIVHLCFDNDHARNGFAGDRMAARIRDAFPQFASKLEDHKPPLWFKDWNDVVTGKRKPEAV